MECHRLTQMTSRGILERPPQTGLVVEWEHLILPGGLLPARGEGLDGLGTFRSRRVNLSTE